ncbi:MAG: ATP-binding protein, partial [Lysobacteraceae bacterium]
DLAGLQGPWRMLALSSALLGLVTYLLVMRGFHGHVHAASTAIAIAAQAAASEVGTRDAQFDALRNELEEHRRLQSELTEAKQAAESAMLAKGEFLATMSHEVRTPLNGIIPMLDLLQSSKLAVDQREMLGTALQSARQLLRIVDDILDYSKLEANGLHLESVGINLRELLESVIRLLERQAQAKGLRLTLHVDPEVRMALRGDPLRLRQVLTNLIGNALKFTERGSISLHVSRLGETRTHHQLRFEVRDTGVGISPDASGKLFTAFSQADASTTRIYGGTGLGLAICKRIVDLMGGHIGVESEIDRGSKFWFEVPLLKTTGEIEGPRNDVHGSRALILTTDEVLQKRLALLLQRWGVDTSFVTSTQDALNQLRASAAVVAVRSYNLLLADLGSIRSTQVALQRNLAAMDSIDGLRCIFFDGGETVPLELRELRHSIVVSRTIADTDLRNQIERLMAGEAVDGAGREREATVSVAEPRASGEQESPDVAQQLIKGRLLLVEDNPVNLMVAQRLIALTGMQCDTAENGEQALEKLDRSHYDIVLMDCQMPVMDGYTATRVWREREAEQRRAHLPIIAMTANAMAGDRQKCLDAGMDDYLSKPVSRPILEETLRRWLAHTARTMATTYAATTRQQPAESSTPAFARPASVVPVSAIAASKAPIVSPPLAATGSVTNTGSPISQSRAQAVGTASDSESAHAAHAVSGLPLQSGPALDVDVVEDLRSAMGDQFSLLVTVFLEDAPGHLAKLEAAAVVNDFTQMSASAHALKSSSANLGAMQVSAIAKRIEHGAREHSLLNPVVAVTMLGSEFHRAEIALRKLV